MRRRFALCAACALATSQWATSRAYGLDLGQSCAINGSHFQSAALSSQLWAAVLRLARIVQSNGPVRRCVATGQKAFRRPFLCRFLARENLTLRVLQSLGSAQGCKMALGKEVCPFQAHLERKLAPNCGLAASLRLACKWPTQQTAYNFRHMRELNNNWRRAAKQNN